MAAMSEILSTSLPWSQRERISSIGVVFCSGFLKQRVSEHSTECDLRHASQPGMQPRQADAPRWLAVQCLESGFWTEDLRPCILPPMLVGPMPYLQSAQTETHATHHHHLDEVLQRFAFGPRFAFMGNSPSPPLLDVLKVGVGEHSDEAQGTLPEC